MMNKTPLLFLCHRIPFPPNKGDKIRSFNILKILSQHFDVYLASFVDDPYDWQYAAKLDDDCEESFLLNQNKTYSKLKGLSAFVTGKSISECYYRSNKMQNWVDDVIQRKQITQVFVYSSVMALFTERHNAKLHQVVDFVDVDSDKWRQYADNKRGVAKWVYAREHRKLQTFEHKVAHASAHALFVSGPEAELFKQHLPITVEATVQGMLNGVDIDYFNPSADFESVEPDNIDVVFTGAMDYWANVDAVLWFVENVWPSIRSVKPNASFYIVGGNPSTQILALDGKQGIQVTGRVEDVRPYIQQARVSVAPLQIARGIQNKVLEALAMAKPVIATSMAIEGITAKTNNIKVTDDPEEFAALVCDFINQPTDAQENRQWIIDNLQWTATLSGLTKLFKA